MLAGREALDDGELRVDKIVLADDARGEPIRAILAAARDRGVPVQRASAHRVKVLAGNGRHDQGVLADVGVPLAQLVPAGVDPEGMPSRARIVIYRRPLEARARDGADLADLLHEVLVEQVAEYLNIEPDAVDGGES